MYDTIDITHIAKPTSMEDPTNPNATWVDNLANGVPAMVLGFFFH